MKKKINIQLVVIAILAVLSTVIGVTIAYYSLFQKQVRKDLAISAKLLRDTHYFEVVNTDTDEIDLSADLSELRVTWIDGDGTVLYDNDTSAGLMSNHIDRPEIQEAFQTGVGESVRKSDTMNKNTFYYAVLLDNNTVLRVATNAQNIWSVFMSAAPIITMITIVIIAICVTLSHLLTKQLLKPIEVMADNLENEAYESPYKELDPIAEKLILQHADVLSAAMARQDFTANISHELKTPLTAITGYAELLEQDMISEEQKHHFYQEIHKNSDRLLSLINDIIRLAELDGKEHEVPFEKIDLYQLLKECEETLTINAEKRNISITLEGKTEIVNGNRDLLKELIENLVLNAIRYNNPGGRVLVSVLERNQCIELIVKDNGIGIPASEQERIFERFYRVDKSRSKATGGTGLGLAIVKHIVEIHGAKIVVDSALGVGTTMTVIF